MTAADDIALGRRAYDEQDWAEACAGLQGAVDAEDLERLGIAEVLVGRDEEALETLQRAHSAYLARGEVERAAWCGAQLAMGYMLRGDHARSSGWIARSRRLLDDGRRDCVELGHLMVPSAVQAFVQGDLERASQIFEAISEIASRFDDPDLEAMGRLGRGQCLIQLGEIDRGLALFDENMVAVTSGEISPIVAGTIYCTIIAGCRAIFDLKRAGEWTQALNDWCESQPGLVPYRGTCLVFRAEIMQLHGDWPAALAEAGRACARLTSPRPQPGAGDAFYQLGELYRLRGEFAEAEAAFREAAAAGRSPHPGLALTRLAMGQVEPAAVAIRRQLDETEVFVRRCEFLPAFVEIMIAAGDLEAARKAAAELGSAAENLRAPFVRALAAQAQGALELAGGEHAAALVLLRSAETLWRGLDIPYEAARTRVLIGVACRGAGDADTAVIELQSARRVFERLGAAPDVARVDGLLAGKPAARADHLSAREVEVLRLLAAGKTNRAIASELFISEKTVARHVSNIFTKLGLASRAAATAYAYEHGLQRRST